MAQENMLNEICGDNDDNGTGWRSGATNAFRHVDIAYVCLWCAWFIVTAIRIERIDGKDDIAIYIYASVGRANRSIGGSDRPLRTKPDRIVRMD